MTLTLTKTYIGPLSLVEFEWPGGFARYITDAGYVTWDGRDWFAQTDAHGQVMELEDWVETVGEISNRQIKLTLTPTIRGYVLADPRGVKVRIWPAERDPSTGALQVHTTRVFTGFVDAFAVEGGMVQLATFTLVTYERIVREPNEGMLNNPSTQARLVTGDTGFDLLGGKIVPAYTDNSSFPPDYGGTSGGWDNNNRGDYY